MASLPSSVVSKIIPSAVVGDLAFHLSLQARSPLPPPTALLLGWYASTPRQLSKYSEFYSSRGYNTIALTLPHVAVFGSDASNLRSRIATELESIYVAEIPESLEPNTLVHTFSNGGVFCLHNLLPSSTPALFQSLQAVVSDSAPCYLYPAAGAKAMSHGLSTDRSKQRMIAALLTPLFAIPGALGWAFGLATGTPSIMERYWNTCADYPFRGPELYIYSDADELCDVHQLELLIDLRRKASTSHVESVNFKTTPHVLHYKNEKDKYTKVVEEFLGTLRDKASKM
jgi:hypothetical protein